MMLVEFAKADGIGRIEGFVLAENIRMLDMCRQMGFTVASHPDEPGVMLVRLQLRKKKGD